MKAVVLAAGEGRRLRPKTKDVPKPMLEIGPKPILQYNLEALRRAGIKEVTINLHYLPQTIRQYFKAGRRFGLRISYSYEKKLLGTAGAIKKLGHNLKETFLVVYGDSLRDIDFKALLREHRKKKGMITIALYNPEDKAGCGIVEINRQKRILRFTEKPKGLTANSRWANCGVYVLEPEVLEYIPPDSFYDFAIDLFPR